MTKTAASKTFSGPGVVPVAACEGHLSRPEQKTGGPGKPAPRGPCVTQSLRASGSFYAVSPGGSSSPAVADSGAGVGRPSRHTGIPAGAPGCTEGDSLDLRAGETSPAFSGGGSGASAEWPAFLLGVDPVVFRKRDAKAFYEGCAAAGLTKTETAKLGGITLGAVLQYALRYEVEFAMHSHDRGLDDAVLTLHREGLSRAAVAERLGVTVRKVRRIAYRLDLRWRERVAKPAVPAKEDSAALGLRLRMGEAKAQLTEKQLENFEYLMSVWKYRFVEALRGVGRYELAAFVEGGK